MTTSTLKLDNFSGGLNQIANNAKLQANETPYCQNVIFTNQGGLEKRKGYTKLNPNAIDSNPITGLYIYHKQDGTEYLIATSGTDIYLWDDVTDTFNSIKTGLTSGERFSFTTLGDKCYMTNGVDPLLVYDGNTIAEITEAPKAKYILDHYNSLIMFDKSTLKYAELADTSTWINIDFPTDDGDIIAGAVRQAGNLVVFKTNSIHVLYGQDPGNFQRVQVQPNIGCVSPRSIVNINNYVYFLSYDGVYSFNGSGVKLMSEKITPTIKKIGNYEDVASAWYDNQYLLSFREGSSTYNNRIVSYNYQHKAWSYFTGINSNVFNNYDGSQDGLASGDLYFGDSQTGYVYKYDEGYLDDDSPIVMKYETKGFDLGSPEIVKTFRRLLVALESQGNVYLTYSIDKGVKSGQIPVEGYNSDPDALFGQSTWGGTVWHAIEPQSFGKSIKSGSYGREIKFIFEDSNEGVTKVYNLALQIRIRRERWR